MNYEFIVKIIGNYYYLCGFITTGDTEQLAVLFKSDTWWLDCVSSSCYNFDKNINVHACLNLLRKCGRKLFFRYSVSYDSTWQCR
jgi:hypothetical protein